MPVGRLRWSGGNGVYRLQGDSGSISPAFNRIGASSTSSDGVRWRSRAGRGWAARLLAALHRQACSASV